MREGSGREAWRRRAGDALLAVLLLVGDVAALGAATVMAGIHRWSTGPVPGMDRLPYLTTGPVAAVIALSGAVLLRGGLKASGGLQVAVSLLAIGALLIGGVAAYREQRPEPAPSTYDPGHTGRQCRSGGDNSECLGG
ncbi:DUF6234 family protein [Streptomyces monticola]|uniref:DUF6234 family protein n=1 Tax=Streptomyces monticola TaxID=2666263 RepID=A0ABW2JPH1_9ACTN